MTMHLEGGCRWSPPGMYMDDDRARNDRLPAVSPSQHSSANFRFSPLRENSRLCAKKPRENDFLQALALAQRLDSGGLDPYRSGRRAAIEPEWERSWAPRHVELDGSGRLFS